MDSGDPGKQSKKIGSYLRYSHLGMQLFLAIGLCTAGGIWLDRKFGTEVLFTLVGLLFGFGTGVYSVYTDLFPPARRRDGESGGDASEDGGSEDSEAGKSGDGNSGELRTRNGPPAGDGS